MANPVIINPTLTLAGQAAAFNAANTGLELKIDSVSFGRAHYDPTGDEIALTDPVGNAVPVAGASRPTPYQIRMVSNWREDVGQVGIGEIGFWSNGVLVFVWSKADGTVASYKTDGVAYVLFNDLAFQQVPAGSISFTVDPDESVALAALAAHEGASNAHPQYVLRAKFPDYQGHLWGDVAGSANEIALVLPEIVDLTTYIKGNRFSFKAVLTNTGATTININGVGAVEVLKTGGVPLTAGSIIAGGVYDVYYDGSQFQLTAGAGFASAEATEAELLQATNPNSTSWVSVRRLLKLAERLAPLLSPKLTGSPTAPSPLATDKSSAIATAEFVRQAMALFGVGSSSPIWVGSVDNIDQGGLFSVGATTVGGLPSLTPPIPQGSQILNTTYSVGATRSGIQVLFDRIYDRLLWRRIDTGVWKPWRSIWHSGDTPKMAHAQDVTVGAMVTVGDLGIGRAVISTEVDLDKYTVPGNYMTPMEGVLKLPTGWSTVSRRYSLVVDGASGVDYLTHTLTSGQSGSADDPVLQAVRVMSTTNKWSQWRIQAPTDSPVFTGTPTAPQPDRGNASGILATTKFVREQGPCYPEAMFSQLTGSTLGTANINKIVGLSATGTVNLPPVGSPVPIGSTFTLMFYSNYGVGTVSAPVGGYISIGTGQYSSIKFTNGDLPTVLMCVGNGTYTLLSGGSLDNLPAFKSAIARTGWKMEPSGLITQWGLTGNTSPTSTTAKITFPVAFTTEVVHINQHGYYPTFAAEPTTALFGFYDLNRTGATAQQIATITGGASPSLGLPVVAACSWFAIGY